MAPVAGANPSPGRNADISGPALCQNGQSRRRIMRMRCGLRGFDRVWRLKGGWKRGSLLVRSVCCLNPGWMAEPASNNHVLMDVALVVVCFEFVTHALVVKRRSLFQHEETLWLPPSCR